MNKYILVFASLFLSLFACEENKETVVKACFETAGPSFTVGEEIAFSNCSENAEYYRWNFGDERTSSEFEPAISYPDPGTYTISLIAENDINRDGMAKDPGNVLGYYNNEWDSIAHTIQIVE
jgi:PKD repeat protein